MINGVAMADIQSGSLYQNGYIERFKRTYCPVVLNLYFFNQLEQARKVIEEWLTVYGTEKLMRHSAM
ncbi:integrase core domain-containing protein [Snodgrassella alvi]|uniref:Integrase catalytic domain-containing protein n=1 Tax=Snodgrassella alvi TaxID=1196083 RepID=A0A2N9WTM5_9NEIS|nr:integrase core domain-containing protein [Snodgrassella alvi]PIT14969.1 hypothetical protein BGI32_06505 [Snodgrassella alvi]PIT15153.1 hypothetical protein BGI34_12960 [Snodgrassella alvi]PIT17682.1 hypothetical protein BGI33_02470 [Snodgrassella alvi]